MKQRHKHFIIFIIFILISCVLSIIQKQGISWDFLNYHLYSPWAFIENRIEKDFVPCGIQSYFNPIGMIPIYLLIKHLNNFPIIVSIFIGSFWGIFSFFMYLISFEVLKLQNENKKIFIAFISALLGSSIVPIFIQIGIGTLDILASIPVLFALYLLLNKKNYLKNIFLSGLLIGIASAIKLTNVIFLPVFILIILFDLFCSQDKIQNKIKSIIAFIGGFILSSCLFSFFWIYILYIKFHNPVFPYANNLFHSELYPQLPYNDVRFNCENIFKVFAWPIANMFQFIRTPEEWHTLNYWHISNIPFYDLRFGLGYICFFILSILNLMKKDILSYNIKKLNLILLFYIISYALFISSVTVVRYWFPVLALSGLFIVLIFSILFEFTKKKIIIIGLFITLIVLILGTTYVFPHQRLNFQDKFLSVENLNFEDSSVVVLTHKIMSYIALTQNPNVKYIGFDIPADGMDEFYQTKIYDEIAFEIMNSASKVYVIKNDFTTDETINRINSRLKPELKLSNKCKRINANVSRPDIAPDSHFNIYLCQ